MPENTGRGKRAWLPGWALAAGCGNLCRERQSGPFPTHRDLPIPVRESHGGHTPHPCASAIPQHRPCSSSLGLKEEGVIDREMGGAMTSFSLWRTQGNTLRWFPGPREWGPELQEGK